MNDVFLAISQPGDFVPVVVAETNDGVVIVGRGKLNYTGTMETHPGRVRAIGGCHEEASTATIGWISYLFAERAMHLVSQESHVKRKLFMNVDWGDVHDFGKLQDERVFVHGLGKTDADIRDVGYTTQIVIRPDIHLLIPVQHKRGFDAGAVFVHEIERSQDWTVGAVVDFDFLFIFIMR